MLNFLAHDCFLALPSTSRTRLSLHFASVVLDAEKSIDFILCTFWIFYIQFFSFKNYYICQNKSTQKVAFFKISEKIKNNKLKALNLQGRPYDSLLKCSAAYVSLNSGHQHFLKIVLAVHILYTVLR